MNSKNISVNCNIIYIYIYICLILSFIIYIYMEKKHSREQSKRDNSVYYMFYMLYPVHLCMHRITFSQIAKRFVTRLIMNNNNSSQHDSRTAT